MTLRITQRCSYGGVVSPLLLNVALHGMEHGRRSLAMARTTAPIKGLAGC